MRKIVIGVREDDFRKLGELGRSRGESVERLIEGALSPLLASVVRKRNDFAPSAMSPAMAKRQRRQLEREVKAQHKRASTAKLAELRRAIKAARASTKPRRADAVELCRIGRQMAKERAKQLRVEGRAAIRAAIEQEKIAAREACAMRKAKVREDVKSEVARARAELREERAFQQEMKRIDASARQRERQRPRSSAKERQGESDDAVRSNLPPELVPLFEAVKRQIKGSDRESRTEQFLRYAEENQAEVIATIEQDVEREIARLQREEAKESRALRRRGVSAAELASIPF